MAKFVKRWHIYYINTGTKLIAIHSRYYNWEGFFIFLN